MKYLLARQRDDGSWQGDGDSSDADHCGETSLVTLALLSAGEASQSPPLARAIAFLKRCKPERTYSVALRAGVYAQLPESARERELRADLGWLERSMISQGPGNGTYTYGPSREGEGDYSNSQYGVLGVWYAQQAGLEVPRAYWQRVEMAWRAGQNADGGWGYSRHGGSSYASMSAAGAATLLITHDYLHSADAQNLFIPSLNAPLDKAMAWLGSHFAADLNIGRDAELVHRKRDDLLDALDLRRNDSGTWVHYMLFGYERVGEASGLTRFGTHSWFEEGSQFLLKSQAFDGHWDGTLGPQLDTSYSLLFLSRGAAPVAVQKLQYDGRWNNRPRDVANLTRFLRYATERHLNWQIVSINGSPAELDEAPLLYMSGDRSVELSPLQKQNLSDYVGRGGLLVCVNEGKENDFGKSIESMCKELWPPYSMRDLRPPHPAFTANFPTKGFTDPIRGLSNGVRELVVLFPSGDPDMKWQTSGGAVGVKDSPYAPLANLLLYATGSGAMRRKGETYWPTVDRKAPVPQRYAHVARLIHGGNWDPEPLSWERLAMLLRASQDLYVRSEPVSLDPNRLTDSYLLAHLTSTAAVDLTPLQATELKRYLDAGGMLLCDSAGGAGEAAPSFDSLLAGLYPSAKLATIPPESPIYTAQLKGQAIDGAHPIESVGYRRRTDGGPPLGTQPRLRGLTVNGRLMAIVSDEDLTAALAGYPLSDISGYSPASARDLVRNILAWRLATK